MTRASMMAFLELVARELTSVDTLEQMAVSGPGLGEEEWLKQCAGLLERWQTELMQHHGWETGFGRSQVKKYSQDKTDTDMELRAAFGRVQQACQWATGVACQERELRAVLQTGPYDPKAPHSDADETVPRRVPRAAGELDSVGPVPRDMLLRFFEETRSLLLGLETRRLLASLNAEYSSWKAEKRAKLQFCAIAKWCADQWESLGYDRRLGHLEVVRATTLFEGDEEIEAAHKAHMGTLKAIQLHATMRMPPGTLPKPAGDPDRRVEPFSELDRAGLPVPEGRELQAEGPVMLEVILKYIQRTSELQGGEWGPAIEELVLETGDLMAADRWRHELMEGFGLTHEYCQLVVVLVGAGANAYTSPGSEEELLEARDGLEKSAAELKGHIASALRSRAAAKAKAKAEASSS